MVGKDQVDAIIDQVNIPTDSFKLLPDDFNKTLHDLLDFDGIDSNIVPNVVSLLGSINLRFENS